MPSIINKLSIQKDLQQFVTNNVFLEKSKNTTTTKQQIKQKNNCRGRYWIRDLLHPKRMHYQLRVLIVVKLLNCFDAMGRNVIKQSRICGPRNLNKFFFWVIFLHAWITISGSFSYLLKYGLHVIYKQFLKIHTCSILNLKSLLFCIIIYTFWPLNFGSSGKQKCIVYQLLNQSWPFSITVRVNLSLERRPLWSNTLCFETVSCTWN